MLQMEIIELIKNYQHPGYTGNDFSGDAAKNTFNI